MMIDQLETIAAIATPLGEGGISIIRLSGKTALEIADRIFFPADMKLRPSQAESHKVVLGRIMDETHLTIDQCLYLPMKAPRSYTGEDVVEFHLHGGIFLTRKVLELVLSKGARLAQPGEYTKRAFLNGKLDLTQAESVLDVIRSTNDHSLKLSQRLLEGQLSKRIEDSLELFTRMLAYLEAHIDFPEEDIGEENLSFLTQHYQLVREKLLNLIHTENSGRWLREGIRVAIVGQPNVGKSTLLNLLLEQDRAIVSAVPGTTRDTIEETYNFDGVSFRLIDTAGWRNTLDPVEQIGMDRSRQSIQKADIVILLCDASQPWSAWEEEIYQSAEGKIRIILLNKIDLGLRCQATQSAHQLLKVSLLHQTSPIAIKQILLELALKQGLNVQADAVAINARHAFLIQECLISLEKFHVELLKNTPYEFLSLELRDAKARLSEIIGGGDNEEILDCLFKNFCIGK